MHLWKSFESFKLWVLEHLPINAADSEGLGPNGTLSKKGRKKEWQFWCVFVVVVIITLLLPGSSNRGRPGTNISRRQLPLFTSEMRPSESFFYLLLSSAKSNMVESWMFPPFKNVSEVFHVYYAKKKRKERKKYGTEVWILFHPVLPHWICQTNNAWLTAAWIVERRGEGLPLIVPMCICFVLFFHDSLLMMMTAADPRGRRA